MKIAVVGGGVSGLSSVWALNEYSSHEVHLFEPSPWIGGHANTVAFTPPTSASPTSAQRTNVDMGFIVFNSVTYPNFLRFLHLTRVEVLNSDMSFSVSRFISACKGYGGFEWAGGSPTQLFCQWTNVFNPAHWRMVWDILRFNHQSVDYLRECHHGASKSLHEVSIGEWLDQRGYSHSFRHNYLIPMTASIWSTAPQTALASFPALTLLRFMHNHHLLQILHRPQWLTIKNGSSVYVERIVSRVSKERVHRGRREAEVVAAWVDARNSKWTLKTAEGQLHAGWDRVIFATHADDTVGILKAGMAEGLGVENVVEVLERFRFSHNVAVLHSDVRLMPVRRSAWSAWNFLAETISPPTSHHHTCSTDGTDVDRVSLTYWMNLLQSLPESKFGPILVTLNPTSSPDSPFTPKPQLVLQRQSYTHPIYTPDTVLAQSQLRTLQGTRNAYFCGAWTNYGFHEDGFTSGLRVAELIPGVYLPFEIKHAEREVAPKKGCVCMVVETLDGVARMRVFGWMVGVVFMVVVGWLVVVEGLLVVVGGSKQWSEAVGVVKAHFKQSVAKHSKHSSRTKST